MTESHPVYLKPGECVMFVSQIEAMELDIDELQQKIEAMERERAEMLAALHDSLGALKSVQEYASSEMVDGQIDDLVELIARVERKP